MLWARTSYLVLVTFFSFCSGNVGNVSSTVPSPYVPIYGEECTNECSPTGDNRYWCGQHKLDGAERLMRCVQYTRYGEVCVAECGGKKEDYWWCPTNSLRLGNPSAVDEDWWDYCSFVGKTIKKESCVDECSKRSALKNVDNRDTTTIGARQAPGIVGTRDVIGI